MNLDDKIYVAGHNGMVGSAIVRALKKRGHDNFVFKSHNELDLTVQSDVQDFSKLNLLRWFFLQRPKSEELVPTLPTQLVS